MINKIEKEPQISKSKYELTLAEFPLFLLSKGGKGKTTDIKSVKYEDTITGKDGDIIPRKWNVYPDSKLGFGTSSTFDTFFDLFQIWKENNFEDQFIQFGSIYNLLKRRGKNDSAINYRQITKDLYCLVGIRIEAKNAFWDNDLKAYVDMTFHLFDQVQLYKDKPNGQAVLPFGRIKASDVLYGSVLKNSLLIANFDSKFFHSLTPVEKRLALYLSKIFRSQTVHKRDLFTFARQIPIYAKQTKHIKERLKKASDGLIKKGFELLESFNFEKGIDGKMEIVVFRRRGGLPLALIPEPKNRPKKHDGEVDLLIQDILEICGDKKSEGFYRKVAIYMPNDSIYRAISEVKAVRDLGGGMRRSEGALFTSLIKKYAKERGVEL
jgi:hypothetical protein